MARGSFQAGKAAYEAGRYEQVLGYFEQAYQQSKRPRMLYNTGQVADRLRRDERALEAFREFLLLVPDACGMLTPAEDHPCVYVELRAAPGQTAWFARDQHPSLGGSGRGGSARDIASLVARPSAAVSPTVAEHPGRLGARAIGPRTLARMLQTPCDAPRLSSRKSPT